MHLCLFSSLKRHVRTSSCLHQSSKSLYRKDSLSRSLDSSKLSHPFESLLAFCSKEQLIMTDHVGRLAGSLTQEAALSLVASFLPDWRHVLPSELSLTKIGAGFCNSVYLVSCTGAASPPEIDCLILRKYGGNQLNLESWCLKNSESEETLIAAAMSQQAIGPTMLGVFPGGRLETYFAGHTLTPADTHDERIVAAIARAYARVHAISLPLRRDKLLKDFAQRPFKLTTEQKEDLRQQVAHACANDPVILSSLEEMLAMEWGDEKRWLFAAAESEGLRQSFTLVDVQALNTLVADSSRSSRDETAAQITLVDYDLASNGYSAMDLGGHLTMRLIDVTNPKSFLSGESFATDAEIRFFLCAYLEESWRLGSITRVEGESDDAALDRLQRETLIGCMMHSLFMVESALATPATAMLAAVPSLCSGLALLVREYRRINRLLFPDV